MRRLLALGLICMVDSAFGDILQHENGLATTLKVNGRFRFEKADNTDYASQRTAMHFRLRPELTISNNKNVSVFIQPQFSKTFGRPDFLAQSSASNSYQASSGALADPSLLIHQATVKYVPVDYFSLTIGRQELRYGDELILSGLDWDNIGRSFDGLKVQMNLESLKLDFFYSKLFASQTTSIPSGNGDSDFAGIYSEFQFNKLVLDTYVLYLRNHLSGGPFETFATGIRTVLKHEDMDLRAELTKEFGNAFENPSNAYQVDVETGVNLNMLVKRVSVELFQAGESYYQFFPLAHKYLGISDIYGRSNIRGIAFHAKADLPSEIILALDLHYFLRTGLNLAPVKINGTSPLGSGTAGESALGVEADLVLTRPISAGVNANFGTGVFFPSGYMQTEFGSHKPFFIYTQISMTL